MGQQEKFLREEEERAAKRTEEWIAGHPGIHFLPLLVRCKEAKSLLTRSGQSDHRHRNSAPRGTAAWHEGVPRRRSTGAFRGGVARRRGTKGWHVGVAWRPGMQTCH